MKNILTLFLVIFVSVSGFSQAKKYLLFEHFTNTNCSICAARNPPFFALIENYPDDVHHIAYHPPYPYINCVFYQHNRDENQNRTDFYSIPGTPRVVWQGGQKTSPSVVTAEKIEEELAETSPIEILVEETTGEMRTVSITIRTVGEKPVGNFKILAAVAEKEVNYAAPNGEDLHHNVFRDMISPISGEIINFAETGGEVTFTYEYELNAEWEADQIYTLAWVQDFDIGDILNSGTRFDPRVTSTENVLPASAINITPNPAQNWLNISLQNIDSQENTLRLIDLTGKEILRQTTEQNVQLDVQNLARGMYLLQIQTEAGTAVKKVILD
ncbi:MAG: T9SS type A sorting domain-containing protein [Saprospiraceae bacterium]